MSSRETKHSNEILLECNWQYAFNLKSGKGTLGYIAEWRGLGGLTLTPDIVLWSPTPGANSPLPSSLRTSSGGGTTADQLKCVAVIEQLVYGGSPSDPIRISAYLSKDNQVKLRSKMTKPLPNTLFKVDYAIVGFDEDSKAWYSAWEIDKAPSQAKVNTADGALQLFVGFEPVRISDTLDTNVYRIEFEMIPGKKSTRLKLASGPQHRYVSEWTSED